MRKFPDSRSFMAEMAKVRRGAWIPYHRGFLWIDREKNRRVNDIANAAYDLYERGQVTLVQKRLYEHTWIYYAVVIR